VFTCAVDEAEDGERFSVVTRLIERAVHSAEVVHYFRHVRQRLVPGVVTLQLTGRRQEQHQGGDDVCPDIRRLDDDCRNSAVAASYSA